MPFLLAYFSVLVVVLIATLWTGYWVYQHREGEAATAFVVTLAVGALWIFGVAIQLLLTQPEAKFVIFHVYSPFTWALPVAWFVFTVYYTGREYWLTSQFWGIVSSYLFVVVVLTITNPWHELMIAEYTYRVDPFPLLAVEHSILYYISLGISYLFVLAGIFLLLLLFLSSHRSTANQAGLLIAGAAILLLANIGYTMWIPVATELNPTPPTVGAFMICVGVALFRHRLFSIQPFARSTVFERINEGVIVIDTDGYVSDFNQRAVEFFPALPDVFGERLRDHYPALVEQVGDDSTTGSEPSRMQIETDDGRMVSADVSPLTVRDTLRGYAYVLQDVTELEAYASRLQRQNRQLDQFAHTLSHDLRNPLNVAQLRTTMLVQQDEDENAKAVQDSLERMETMIDEMLEMARAGDTIEETDEYLLAHIVTEAWENVNATGSNLDCFLDQKRLEADQNRLLRVFENLFRNALEHNDRPLTIRVGLLDSSDGFFVEDTGIGIPEDRREEIFNYGYSMSNGGTGYGLAIVREIVEAHGWSITVTDSKERGARFEIVTG